MQDVRLDAAKTRSDCAELPVKWAVGSGPLTLPRQPSDDGSQ
jgi:hypothetical protein